ncbi:hypothetical protein ACFQW6_13020 [Nocardioides sp. GCM10028917]|uniref:hypothetical protein n=1 Tax=Nocardioides sp. GCM10028917 TaxID=3273408 RepID=UPI0036228962
MTASAATDASKAEWLKTTKSAWLKKSKTKFTAYKRTHPKATLKTYRAEIYTLTKYRKKHPFVAPPSYRWIPLAAAFEPSSTDLPSPSLVPAGGVGLPELTTIYDNMGGTNASQFTQPASERWSCTSVVVGAHIVKDSSHKGDVGTQTWQFVQESGTIVNYETDIDEQGANSTLALDGSKFTLNVKMEGKNNSITIAPFGGKAFCTK